ncbi:hypothetical protein pipiens_004991 [Culex pipiens pipiens]|uniref:Arrestin C-terminal-like domain-containing protein n=1 Tax=Culex pipiens pipiens TaxID=38569 RepID=A0ABD1CCK2_CULPP
MTHCEIKFHNNSLGIYYAGQTLAGSAELRLEKSKKLKEFILTISGIAEISWTEKDGDGKESSYSGTEQLLEAVHVLIKPKGSESDTIEIPAGIHVYNFECALPSTLPTSFEGYHGHIRYTVSATIVRPWKFNQTSKAAFTVLQALDLNLGPELLRQPSKAEFSKRFCCWPCSSGPLHVTVRTPIAGYVPGQIIHVMVLLDNASSVTVNCLVTSLVRIVTYISSCGRTNVDTKSIASVENVVTDDRTDRFSQHMVVPSIAPNISCSVLNVSYELLVTIKVGCCRISPRLRIPLTIGTVPIVAAPTTVPTAEETANYGTFGAIFGPSAPVADSVDPPTYAEAISTTSVNVNDHANAIGVQSYVPRYPVYKFGAGELC